jgi:protein-disulfide isomerase
MSVQKIALSVLSFTAAAYIGFAPALADTAPVASPSTVAAAPAAGAALSKEQVQQMIHDYIMANPELIMQSVDNFQRKTMADRQAHASEDVKKNKDILTKDTSSPEAGNPQGDVTVIEFFDYNCHFCKGAFPAVQTLLDKDKKVRVVFKEFPILGPSSEAAAKWALAAQKQKKYFEFHAAMMNNKEPINDAMLESVAKSVGMDVDKAKIDISSPDVLAQLEKNRALADQLDINGTPAFIIGDDISRGAIPEDAMEQKISALRAAGVKK